jgi:hypothetical protein
LQTYKEKNQQQKCLIFPMLQMELGMAFIESVIASGKSDKKWFDFKI